MKKAIFLLCWVLLLPILCLKGEQNNTADMARIKAWNTANQSKFNDTERFMLRKGLVADKKEGTVTVVAESCGLMGDAIVEFGIVGEFSDRAYEALFRAFARGVDIGDALEFVGVPRGANFSTQKQRYWSKGERIEIEVAPFKDEEWATRRIEEYVFDKESKGVLEATGFVYAGSPRITAEGGDGKVALLDIEPPMSILSFYNEPQTLLDVPRQSDQGMVYERYVVNPRVRLKDGDLVRLVMRRERRASKKDRVRDIELHLKATGEELKDIKFQLREKGAKTDIASLAELIQYFKSTVENGYDPFVALYFDDDMSVSLANVFASVIEKIEGERGVRIEPPPKGQVFYRAFLPEQSWRDRGTRLSQPWELHIGGSDAAGGDPRVKLVRILEDWSDPDSIDPKLTPVEFQLAGFDEIVPTLTKEGFGLPVLLVYIPKDMKLSVFMPTLRRLADQYPTLYIFGEG